jgi:hypothetical protein
MTPDEFLVLAVLSCLAVIVLGFLDDETPSPPTHIADQQLPAEIASPREPTYYKEQTARLSELRQKLEAETALAEQYLKAARTMGELDELPEIIAHENAKRAQKRNGGSHGRT